MGFDWYESDDTTLAGTSFAMSTSAGTPSAAIELHAWLNKGSSVGASETRYLRLYVEDSGVYKTSGLDVLDRREVEWRIIGSQNPDGVPEFSAPTTAWKPLGTRRSGQLPALYPNCCIELEFRHNPTAEGGQSTPVTFRVKAVQGTGDVPMSIPDDVSVDGNLDFGAYTLSNVVLSQADAMDAGGYGITNLNRSGTKTDAASVEVVLGRPLKRPVQAAATGDLTLSGEQTVDGVALVDGDRCLAHLQSTAADRGIYTVKAGAAWERYKDADDSYQVYAGCMVWVEGGSTNGRALWVQTGTFASQVWESLVALP